MVMKKGGRILPQQGGFYVHAMSRVVNRQFVLGDAEKEYFCDLMRSLAEFSGLEIVTYVVMDNHFHMLLEIPEPQEISDKELLRRLSLVSDKGQVGEVRQRLERFKAYKTSTAYDQERELHLKRMYNLGFFMKALKQQFTRWYNRKHKRKGTLWEAKYKSVVVEGAGNPLETMAAYIDLNPVRAGICSDPKDYRWCGYADALGGSKKARAGLTVIADLYGASVDWRMVRRRYTKTLLGHGLERGVDEAGKALKKGFTREEVQRRWENDEPLRKRELMRCRVRYFSDGVVFGSNEFVDNFFNDQRDRFSERRKTGSRAMAGGDWQGLCTVRDLRVDVINASEAFG